MLGIKLLGLWTVCVTLCTVSADESERCVCTHNINIQDGLGGICRDQGSSGGHTKNDQQVLVNISGVLSRLEKKADSCFENQHMDTKPRDCGDIKQQGHNTTGIYTIYPQSDLQGFPVRCDMNTNSSGWTVIQRRISDSDFYKKWNEYQLGFGDLHTNFWIGNQLIYLLTSQAWYELRVELTSMDNETAYAEYQVFSVGDAESKYKLLVDGYSGNAGDALAFSNGMKFTTNDQDNDLESRNCAMLYVGAWWYNVCHFANLNGQYGNTEYAKGPVWNQWKGYYSPMKMTEMKIRRGKSPFLP